MMDEELLIFAVGADAAMRGSVIEDSVGVEQKHGRPER
jgi:hypothetical protein